jgi:molecular chaperone HscB
LKADPVTPAKPAKCATCEALHQVPLACHDCHVLLAHLQGADYFEVFGLSRGYDIDLDALQRKYLAISKNIHPDRFAAAGEEMQSLAQRLAAAVNKARDVLHDPFTRAEYLLETAGGPSAAQDKSVPGDLLTQVMDWREELEQGDAASDGPRRDALMARISAAREKLERDIAELCHMLAESDDETKRCLRRSLNGLKYLRTLTAQTARPAMAP